MNRSRTIISVIESVSTFKKEKCHSTTKNEIQGYQFLLQFGKKKLKQNSKRKKKLITFFPFC